MRVFAGLVSDPLLIDVEAAQRTTTSATLSFSKQGTNSVEFRDVLSIVVEAPIAPIVDEFSGITLIAAVSENFVRRRGKPIPIERLGRPEIKNFILQEATHDPVAKGVELRDLYNREDAFALSKEYRPLYKSRLDANLAVFDGFDGKPVAARPRRASPAALRLYEVEAAVRSADWQWPALPLPRSPPVRFAVSRSTPQPPITTTHQRPPLS